MSEVNLPAVSNGAAEWIRSLNGKNGQKEETQKDAKNKVPAGVSLDYIRGGIEGKYFKREGGLALNYGPFIFFTGSKHIIKNEPGKNTQVDFPLTMIGGGCPVKSNKLTAVPYILYGPTGVAASLNTQTPFGTAGTTLSGKGDYGVVGIKASYNFGDEKGTVLSAGCSTGKGSIKVHQSETRLSGIPLTLAPAKDSLGEVGASSGEIGISQNMSSNLKLSLSYTRKYDWLKYSEVVSASISNTTSLGVEWQASKDISVSGKINYTNFEVPGMSGPQSQNNLDYGIGIKARF